MKKPSKETPKAIEIITDRLITLMEAGVVPWDRPWRGVGAPRNIKGRPYSGINAILLASAHYDSPFWLTFNQAKTLEAKVRQGEQSWPVLFASNQLSTDEDGEQYSYRVWRYYNVFNTEQVDGIPQSLLPKLPKLKENKTANGIVKRMPKKPVIRHGFRYAAYDPKSDAVELPNKGKFKSSVGYYNTLFHELVHSTGHKSRLDRSLGGIVAVGKEKFGKEELIAEIGAAALCHTAHIWKQSEHQSASYLKHWLDVIKGNRETVVSAMRQADRAANFILGLKEPEFTNQNGNTHK
jgi:antirestriction protein ArdC